MKLEAVDYQASDAAVKFATSLRETGFGAVSYTHLTLPTIYSV